MTDARATLGSDRLPWLTDEPMPKPTAPVAARTNIWVAVIVGLLLVAGASYWLGSGSVTEPTKPVSERNRSVTAPLPNIQTEQPQKQVEVAPAPEVIQSPAPEVRPVPQRQVSIQRPRPSKQTDEVQQVAAMTKPVTAATSDEDSAPPAIQNSAEKAASPPAAVAERPLRVWPAWQSQGADGRIVRIGAFGSRQQAKLGWHYMVRAYPAVAHLKATVVGESNSRGRHFYRFQIGTTSQAHSEVLCQRMEKIHLSCAVVGLSWKPKGVER